MRLQSDDLTSREREVLRLVRVGLTNEKIAQRLGITVAGAKYHVSEILSKLGVASREEAALWRPSRRPWWEGAVAALGAAASRLPFVAKALAVAASFAALAGLGVLAYGVLRSGDNENEQVRHETTSSATTSTPAVIGSYDDPFDFRSFGRRMADAIRRRDVDFFIQNADFQQYACDQPGMPGPPKACEGQPPGTSFDAIGIGYMGSDGGIMALQTDYRQFIEELLTNFDASASDEYGGGQTQLYAWAKIAPGRSSGYPDETIEAVVSRITQEPPSGDRLPQGASVSVFFVSYTNGAWMISNVAIGSRGSGEAFVNPEIAADGFFGFWSRWGG